MNQNTTASPPPEISPPGSPSPPPTSKSESCGEPQDRHTPVPEPSTELEESVEAECVSVKLVLSEIEKGGPEGLNRVAAESPVAKTIWPVGMAREFKRRGERIARLESELGMMRGHYEGVVKGQAQEIQAMGGWLRRTEELLATRSAELSGTQTFLSTTDRLSEAEVLGIVRDLNENIYQVAVNLTERWVRLESSQATSQMNVDPTSQPQVPVLVQLVRNRDPTGLTFLLQSYLCSQVVGMTSSWGHYPESAILESIYQCLSASEGQAISARWRSLTHSHLSRSPPHSALLVERLANVVGITGSFQSTQQSLELVQVAALKDIESIIQLSLRLELAFKVEVKSSDMTLLFEAPDTTFDSTRMVNEFGSDGVRTPGRRDRIAGTTEVGVGKRCGGPDGSRQEEILLKTKVVLERDVVNDGK